MGLNKSKGNMYPWIDATWNPIRGRCPHDCLYCYARRTWSKDNIVAYIQEEQNTKLGTGKKIFVGSSVDIWANDIPEAWDLLVLAMCHNYPGNEYLFQTKNPERFYMFQNSFPPRSVLGVTLESNRNYPDISKAPSIIHRQCWMMELRDKSDFPMMISIEPILDFDLDEFVTIIQSIRPSFVSIGADSKNHHLPEPAAAKLEEFLLAMRRIREPSIEVRIKDNLKRLL
jgi:DNA repair photolyase